MPALNFSVFKDKLVRAEKPHTIRKSIPRGWEIGKPLSLYTGMRTKGCHKLVDAFCGGCRSLFISSKSQSVNMFIPEKRFKSVRMDPVRLAKNDGFESVEAFWEYFKDYKELCYLLQFDMHNFTPTQWALEALKKGVLK